MLAHPLVEFFQRHCVCLCVGFVHLGVVRIGRQYSARGLQSRLRLAVREVGAHQEDLEIGVVGRPFDAEGQELAHDGRSAGLEEGRDDPSRFGGDLARMVVMQHDPGGRARGQGGREPRRHSCRIVDRGTGVDSEVGQVRGAGEGCDDPAQLGVGKNQRVAAGEDDLAQLGFPGQVGEGPVETILAARESGGPFRDLDNFCRRVDMRQVNRRALESLIKVGALRPFGTRAQLLPIVDNVVALSANLHRARDVGQMSLFGEATGVHLLAEETLLPPLSQTPEVPQKEILVWEKDLVGVYISEHPLSQVLPRLRDVVTVHAGSLSGESNGQQVTIAGMVQRVRRHITKKGDEMAFVTLEDLQGTCDVVVFPRVWSQTKDLWQPDNILVLGGKIDAGRRDEPNLLCDWVKTPNQVPMPVEPARPAPSAGAPPPVRPVSRPRVVCVTLIRSKEAERDVQTMRQVHALLSERDGQDHFRIRVVNGAGTAQELMFPNTTTRYTPELERRLVALVGEGAVRVEEGIV